MIKIKNENVAYNKLLAIDSDADKHTCDYLGITDRGELLFIREKESNGCYIEYDFFQIDKDEYLKLLGIAAKNIYLERSISKRNTIFEVTYNGMRFAVGSSVKYLIHHKECSVFTDNTDVAEKYDFDRIDKFEYEKTLRINECDTVRIIHKDAESGLIFVQYDFSPAEFEEWLDTLI